VTIPQNREGFFFCVVNFLDRKRFPSKSDRQIKKDLRLNERFVQKEGSQGKNFPSDQEKEKNPRNELEKRKEKRREFFPPPFL